jgi:hypothetical protein
MPADDRLVLRVVLRSTAATDPWRCRRAAATSRPSRWPPRPLAMARTMPQPPPHRSCRGCRDGAAIRSEGAATPQRLPIGSRRRVPHEQAVVSGVRFSSHEEEAQGIEFPLLSATPPRVRRSRSPRHIREPHRRRTAAETQPSDRPADPAFATTRGAGSLAERRRLRHIEHLTP